MTPWLTLRGEALRVTQPLTDPNDDLNLPRFDAKAMARPHPLVNVIFGAENFADDPGLILGVRAGF